MDKQKIIDALKLAKECLESADGFVVDDPYAHTSKFLITDLAGSIIIADAIRESRPLPSNILPFGTIELRDVGVDMAKGDDQAVDVLHTSEGSYPQLDEPTEEGYWYLIFPTTTFIALVSRNDDDAYLGSDFNASVWGWEFIYPVYHKGFNEKENKFNNCKWVKISPQL